MFMGTSCLDFGSTRGPLYPWFSYPWPEKKCGKLQK